MTHPVTGLALSILAAAGAAAACGDGAPPAPQAPDTPSASSAATAVHTPSAPSAPSASSAPTQGEPEARLPLGEAATDPLASTRGLRDPGGDDWEIEHHEREVYAWWKRVAAGDDLTELLAPDLELTPLQPRVVSAPGSGFTVARGVPTDQTAPAGPEEFRRALAELIGPDGWGGLERRAFKVVRVEPLPDGHAVRLRVELVWPAAEGTGKRQVVAYWDTRWTAEEPTRLARVEVTDYQSSEGPPGRPLFTDVTEAVLGANASFERQLGVGLAQWAATLDAGLGISVIGHQGLALGDADGDGLDDLYVCQPGGLPNLLFLRRADGTAEDVSREAGVDWLDASRSALFVDLDGDGDQDLVVEADPDLLLMRNEGGARFTLAATARAPATTSLAAADADGDGDLDLYACAYVLPDAGERVPLPYHDANNGRRNTYLENQSEGQNWSFVDATAAAGLDRNNRRFSFAAAWEDYDGDGDQDLYVANDFGRNNLYRNDTPPGGPARFVDVAAAAGVEDMAAGMGVTWGDIDGDGFPDLYVSNMFSSAGGRITYQRRFLAQAPEEERASYRRHARGNSLFRNQGDGTFRDVSEEAGVTMGRWSWGALFTDFENDGRLDLVVPNGFVSGTDPVDL